MNKKALLTIACAVIAGIAAVLLVNRYISQQESSLYEGMNLVSVTAITRDARAGVKLNMSMLGKRMVPSKFVHGNAVSPEDAQLVVDQTLKFPLKRGDTLLWTDVAADIERLRVTGLAGLVTKGERALSIAMDSVAGVSGMLKPNDHIDILCTVRSEETGDEATLTLLQNITVLAAGRSLARDMAVAGHSYSAITVLVTLEEAELLVFSAKKGSLVAVLRNPEDIQTFEDIPKVKFSNIMKPEFRKRIQKTRNKIEVIKMGKTSK